MEDWMVGIWVLLAGGLSATERSTVPVDTHPYWKTEDPWTSMEDSPREVPDTQARVGPYLVEGSKGMWARWIPRGTSATIPSGGKKLEGDSAGELWGDRRMVGEVYLPFRMRAQFAQYRVGMMKSAPLAAPDFRTDPAAGEYRTRIREGCLREGVNFAGHYTVVEWGCGAGCQMMAVVDRVDGSILYSKIPFDTADGHCGTLYRSDSRLMLINTEVLDGPRGWRRVRWRVPAVFVLEKKGFRQVD